MGLNLIVGSIVSAVCDLTGETDQDSQVKVRRLINMKGPGFVAITNWPFLRTDITFSLTTTAYTYSGSSYLPENFKRIVAAHLVNDNSAWLDLDEISIKEAYEWANPNDNQGTPNKFCISRPEGGYYQIRFNRLPDSAYTFEADIEQKWKIATANTSTLIITDDYMETFCYFIAMARAQQQGDLESYALFKNEWYNPNDPKATVLGRALLSLKSPLRRPSVRPKGRPKIITDYGTKREAA